MIIVYVFLIAFVSSYWLTYLIRRYALNRNLLDKPNERSSHSIPTPRGGGLSVVIVFLITLLGLKQFNLINMTDNTLIGLLLSSTLVTSIGFWDDHQSIPARWRFLIHISAIFIALISFSKLPSLIFLGILFKHPVFSFIFYTLALAWLLNLYNFMDGIDGLASCEAISVSLSAALLLFIQQNNDWSLVLVLLAVCVAGFLIWNWPHAKIFMGDACSGFLGFILGVLALLTSFEGLINLWSWFILLAVFITDSTVTLTSRILTGKQWYQAHCTHAYQYHAHQLISQFKQQGLKTTLARTYAHRQINSNLIMINLFWLLPLATIATFYPFWGLLVSMVAYSPLIIMVKHIRAIHTQ